MQQRPKDLPSWRRWPPNCCETCVHWAQNAEAKYVGKCVKSDFGETTDSRFRCADFQRKQGV